MSRRDSRISISIAGFDHIETRSRDHIDRIHSQQKQVFDDQHHGSCGSGGKTHARSLSANGRKAGNIVCFRS
jgi:hypothetical protein